MAAWSGVVALSGFRYDGARKSVFADPRVRAGNFKSFWSTGTGWGTFSQTGSAQGRRFTLSVLYGNLPCQSVELAQASPAGVKSSAMLGGRQLQHQVTIEGKRTRLVLAEPVRIEEGDWLVIVV